MTTFDVIVVGAGAAGLTAAFTANGLGKKVLLIDHSAPGGECTWSGCIPSKALIQLAKEAHIATALGAPAPDTEIIMNRVREASQVIYQHETPQVIADSGVTFMRGMAVFKSSHEISIGKQVIRGKKFILATGSRPAIPPIPGLKTIPYLTNDSFFQQQSLPQSMVILGAGAMAIELGQALVRLGVRVTLIEMMPQILSREEPTFAAAIRDRLEAEGVSIHCNQRVVSVAKTASGVAVSTEVDGQPQVHYANQLFLATGRQAVIEGLALENANIDTSKGLQVNAYLQTQKRHIYACGDIVGPYQLSHMANFQAKLAARNAVIPLRKKVDYQHVCWATFCDPEFARAGLTEQEARQQYGRVRVYHYDLARLDRARIRSANPGMIKIILDRKGYLLGAHILGERAGELIAQIQTLKTLNIPFTQLQQVIHPYPTYADALRQLSQQVWIDDIQRNVAVRLVKGISRLFHRPG